VLYGSCLQLSLRGKWHSSQKKKGGKWHDVLYTYTSVPVMEEPVAGSSMFLSLTSAYMGKGVSLLIVITSRGSVRRSLLWWHCCIGRSSNVAAEVLVGANGRTNPSPPWCDEVVFFVYPRQAQLNSTRLLRVHMHHCRFVVWAVDRAQIYTPAPNGYEERH